MKQIFVVASRALGRISGQTTTVLAFVAFLSAVGALFANGLFAAEGTVASLPSIWALSVAYVLPLLSALMTMRLWSDDGVSDRIEIDLVAPVPERVFAVGRFLAAFAMVVCAIVFSLSMPLIVLPRFAPDLSVGFASMRFLPALVALALFALPLVAVGLLAGICLRRAMSAALASCAITYALPFVAYRALLEWSPIARAKLAEFPVMAQISDAADGFFSAGVAVAAVAFAGFAVYASSKAFALRRFVGGGALMLKVSSVVAVLSALLAALLLSALAFRLDTIVEWPGATRTAAFSARTRDVLSGISRPVNITACIRRDAANFLSIARLLRALAVESHSVAGAGLTFEFVDPRWDPNAATRLARIGVGEGMIVFSVGHRRIVVPAKDVDEGVCASAIQRLSMPAKAETVLFTCGHGEPSIDDFGPLGFSDAACALRQDGYRVGSLFSVTSSIPDDCSVVVVAGARLPFSAAELRDLGMFLARGGRVLATVSPDMEAGVFPLLEAHGMAISSEAADAAHTTDGSDIVVTGFGDHAVSRQLEGSAIVFAKDAVRFKMPSGDSERADGFSLASLCVSGESTFAVSVEKGAALKSDLAIRPTRMVVIGDPSFFLNDTLVSRANANRDFFLNSVAWLAGLDVSGSTGVSGNVLSTRMDRPRRIAFLVSSACVLPGLAAIAGLFVLLRRRRRR